MIADDQDNEHLGFMGNDFARTPNLDRLAEGGTVFTTAHTPPRCRPSLACLLSGRWPHQSGIYFNRGPAELAPTGTLPRLLAEAGYATFKGGKFWEGEPSQTFDHPEGDTGWLVRKGQDELFAFVDEFAGKQPLFVWWAPTIPHMPHDPPPRCLDLFRRESIPLPEWFSGDPELYRAAEHSLLAMGAWFDQGLGELTDRLKSAGVYQNTLFVFLIDNGWSNGLVAKGSPFEKGISTPLVFSWGGEIPAGARLDELVDEVDVFPTVLDYAGVPIPDSASGRSLRAAIDGRASVDRHALHGVVYNRHALDPRGRPHRDAYAIYTRTKRWKYILYLADVTDATWDIMAVRPQGLLRRTRGDEDLFDLDADPYELRNLAGDPAQRPRMDEMRASALGWWRESGGRRLDLP